MCAKGTKEVKIRKASTGHKRFTFTPVISADGTVAFQHVLFSKLKNRPSIGSSNVIVDVNGTGMWNHNIVEDFLRNHLAKQKETAFCKQPVHLILDSYGSCLKVDAGKWKNLYNIHIIFIPKNMTNILQPLDVVLNRSFQQFYDKQYNGYLDTALEDRTLRTTNRNIKISSYSLVSKWCSDFSQQYDSNLIVKAFSCCGIIGSNSNEINSKLKEVLSGNPFNLEVEVDKYFDDGQDYQEITDENAFHQFDSLFEALSFSVQQDESVLLDSIISAMKEDGRSPTDHL